MQFWALCRELGVQLWWMWQQHERSIGSEIITRKAAINVTVIVINLWVFVTCIFSLDFNSCHTSWHVIFFIMRICPSYFCSDSRFSNSCSDNLSLITSKMTFVAESICSKTHHVAYTEWNVLILKCYRACVLSVSRNYWLNSHCTCKSYMFEWALDHSPPVRRKAVSSNSLECGNE
jgi:hypothetical protein